MRIKVPLVHGLLGVILAAGLTGGMVWAQEGNADLEQAIADSYVFKTYLKDGNIKVHAADGLVTLTGSVPDQARKDLAEETTLNNNGVKSVNNQLVVKENLPAVNSDAWLGVKVKSALLFHRNVSALRTQVDVKDGVITLSGDADSAKQKELTEAYARDIEGVKSVVNYLKIVEPTNANADLEKGIDDASITAQAKMALLAHRSTSAIRTKVKTRDGVVTVSGNAKSVAEKELVSALVEDINGVKNVINEMGVQP